MQQGWIKLHRKIRGNWLYEEKRVFSKFEAWIDLLMRANHEDRKIVLGNELIDVKRGQLITSELKLMEAWKWGKSKTRSFLELLEKDGMIVKKSDRKKTTITICNYSVYHDKEIDNRPQADRKQTDNRLITDTEKNVKNVKNDKEDIYTVEILDYLNDKADKKFKKSTKKTQTLINARLSEGFTVEDFKTVIDKKVNDWKSDNKMNRYLRPETLFGTKFEGYLNEQSENNERRAVMF